MSIHIKPWQVDLSFQYETSDTTVVTRRFWTFRSAKRYFDEWVYGFLRKDVLRGVWICGRNEKSFYRSYLKLTPDRIVIEG